MNFSEFKRRLGAEPLSGDPELQRARHSSPEFEAAAAEAGRFEDKLIRAISLPAPEGLVGELQSISQQTVAEAGRGGWWRMALAASVLVAVGASVLTWNMNRGWDSVEDYLVDHYSHDGSKLIAQADGSSTVEVQTVLAEFDVKAMPALADIVGVIKYCPTPDGRGVHMVLNTQNGPVTVFYMPETAVTDKEMLAFDNVKAILVELPKGAAAIIGAGAQDVTDLYAIVHDSIVPAAGHS